MGAIRGSKQAALPPRSSGLQSCARLCEGLRKYMYGLQRQGMASMSEAV